MFFMAFTSAFAFTSAVNLPIVFSIASCVSFLFCQVYLGDRKKLVDSFFLVFLMLVTISFCVSLFSSFNISARLNYYVSIIVVVFLFYYLPLLFMLNGGMDRGRWWLFFGFVFVCVWIFVEFIGRNFIGFDIDLYIPRKYLSDYASTALVDYFRARGPVEESGHMALYLIVVFFIVYSEIKKVSPVLTCILFFLGSVSLIFTFSVAAFIELPVAILLACMFFNAREVTVYLCRNPVKILMLSIVFCLTVWGAYDFLYELLYSKINGSSSINDRFGRFYETIHFIANSGFLNFLIGFGPGSAREFNFDLVLSSYVLILADYGFLGLILFVSIFIYSFFELYKIIDKTKQLLLAVAFFSLVLHFFVIPNYWYPWPWFLLAYIRYTRVNV
ncbi:hypothetical protein KDX31_14045 [Amphritea atlantica]|uniref:Polymerase n=1 Tax=Amphritea atlantica TaxID=355243 RepID=A0ABY5GRU6_9GAMM|nr:hypothetical protein KDX31_14045 [Amphritea atlantica]